MHTSSKFDFNRDLYLFGLKKPRLQTASFKQIPELNCQNLFKYRINNDVRKHLRRLKSSVLPTQQRRSSTNQVVKQEVQLFQQSSMKQNLIRPQDKLSRPQTQMEQRRSTLPVQERPHTTIPKVRFTRLTEAFNKLSQIENRPIEPVLALDLQTNDLTEGEKLYIIKRRSQFFENIKPYLKSTKQKSKRNEIQNTILSESSSEGETEMLNIF